MKNNTIVGDTPILYDFERTDDKHYFAGLLNMAERNFNIALHEVMQRTEKNTKNKKAKINCEAYIDILYKKDITQNDWDYRIEILSEFLPVTKALKPYEDKETFKNTLLLFNETLNSLRNFYTHYYHPPIEIDKAIFELLDKLLFTATLNVKKKRLKTDINKVLLPKQYEEDLKIKLSIHNTKYKEKYDSERNLPTNKNKSQKEFEREFNKKNKKYNEEDFVNTYFNTTFRSLIYKDPEVGIEYLKETAVSKSPEGNQFSKNGFIFFLSFFIGRKYLEELFNHTEGFKGQHELRFMVTRWVFSSYAFKDVRKVLRSDYTQDAFLLQLIEELNKCPKELFDTLDEQHQLEFFEDINEYYKDNEENSETLSNSLVVHNVLRKRYDDKFPYFALRFLDEFVGFTNLKFQIVLGNYIHDSRTKNLKGINISTERTVKEKIKVFGKLSEIDAIKKAYFSKKTEEIKEAEEKGEEVIEPVEGWEEYPVAHYKLDNNNIAIYLNITGFIKELAPKADRANRPSKKKILDQLIDHGFVDSEPIAFLSVNELPALLYEILFNNKTPRDIENIIIGKIMSQIKNIKNFTIQSEIDKHKIPKRLIQLTFNSIAANEINFKKLLKDINTEIDNCDEKLSEHSKMIKDSKPKRRLFNNKQKGEIATWLADDIKRFAGKTTRENWKSHQHSELQALLAFFAERKEEVRLLLEKEIGMLINSHQTLQVSFGKNNLEDFYDTYLKTRKKILGGYKTIIEANQKSYHEKPIKKEIDKIFNFFSKRLYTSSAIEKYRNELLQKPVNLPRGIFDAENFKAVQKGDEDNFQPWFRAASKKGSWQDFYNFPRTYEGLRLNPLSDKGLLGQNNNKPVPSEVFKNEKRLREVARQDFYILEMAKFILRKLHPLVKLSENYSLKELFQTKEEKEKIKIRSAEQSQREVGDRSENIIDESHLLLKRFKVTIAIGNKKITDTVALKEIGKFKHLEKDKRVEILLNYNDKLEWTKKEIEDEIENYEIIRKELFFKEVHLLEQKILEKAKFKFKNEIHPTVLEQDGNPNFKHYIAYLFFSDDETMFKKFTGMDFENEKSYKQIFALNKPIVEKAYFLVLLRNKFSHNELPVETVYKKMNEIVEVNGTKIGDYLLTVFKECYKL